ncbi:MAG: hemerythrin domain-containing protein [Burkholderiaceae bacterium]|nr:hemerythrin domain-containing protein [Burkholderiaceae bacterium]
MPGTRTSTSRTTSRSRSRKETENDPIALLEADHREVEKMFKDFEKKKEKDRDAAIELVGRICTALTVHTQIEEEIFYPTMREWGGEKMTDLLDEAEVEHASAKDLIEQIASMSPDEELYDAKVTVLGEYVKHHVKEEEDEMFPKAKKADVDMEELGRLLAERKQELMQEMGDGAAAS